ncbi:MAG: DUF4215 domain-containing protein [Patescibacteria group bacterium]
METKKRKVWTGLAVLCVAFATAGVLAVGCGSDTKTDEPVAASTDAIMGCDYNAKCTTLGQYCFFFPGDPTSGQLVCDIDDLSNKHWASYCEVGYYCGEDAGNENGCDRGDGDMLACNNVNHALREIVCGDGNVDAPEVCDDGNVEDCDGCRGDCSAIETGCGDGFLCGTEACDDGNTAWNDGCNPDCTTENCGDGIVQAGEECDDGTNDGFFCDPNCTFPNCGNGVVNPLMGEECDDGVQCTDGTDCTADPLVCVGIGDDSCATRDEDGCNADCSTQRCGDGQVNGTEECDDGNTVNTDGCTNACLLPVCGDGYVQAGEQCDDGDAACGGDCNSTCQFPVCGDGCLDANEGEECDDGNTDSGDACQYDCTLPSCGDGILDEGEACDDGNLVNGDGCNSLCQIGATCTEENPVPCLEGAYGCLPVDVSYCLSDPDGPGGNPPALQQCLCANESDGNKGTWKAQGSTCDDQCWSDPVGAGGAGGAGAGGAGAAPPTGGSGGTGGTTTTTTSSSSSSSSSTSTSSSSSSSSSSTSGTGGAGGAPPVPTCTFGYTVEPGFTPSGSVYVVGGFLDSGASYHSNWGTGSPICTMSLSGTYSCDVGSVLNCGHDLYFNVAGTSDLCDDDGGSTSWFSGDWSSFFCGGDGSYFGTPTLTCDGVPVSFSPVANPDGPPYYNSYVATLPCP